MDQTRPLSLSHPDIRNRLRSYDSVMPTRRPVAPRAVPMSRRPLPVHTRQAVVTDGIYTPVPKQVPVNAAAPMPPQPQRTMPIAQVNHRQRKQQGSFRHVTTRPARPSWFKRLQYRLVPNMMTAMAAIIFVTGMGVTLNSWYSNRKVVAQVGAIAQAQTNSSGDSEIQTGNIPDETPPHPSAYRNHTAAPDAPRYIRIPDIKVNTRVIELDLKKDGQLQTPASIFASGWYRGSAKPGQAGAMLVDGHVGGPTKPGVFAKLKDLQPGALIEVEQGDGKKLKYKVVKSKQYAADKVDMAAASVPVEPGKPGLNLITCAGTLNTKEFSYDQRLVVFTTLVK